MKTKPVLLTIIVKEKKDHSSATEKRKLSLQSLNSHLEAISITKNVDANTTAVNNTY